MRVLVATTDGLGAVDRAGTTATLVPGRVYAVAPGVGNACWAILEGHELVRVETSGTEKVSHTGEDARCVVATANDVFVGTVGAHILHLLDGELGRVESFEMLDSRDEWTQPWGAPGDLRSFATDGHDTVFANVHVGGVLRTHDRGESWVQTIDPDVDVHQVALASDGRLFAATGASGLALSTDGGATWDFATAGLHGTYLRAVAPVPGGVVVSASTGPFTKEAAVYRKHDDEFAFQRCDDGLPARFADNIDSHLIAAAGEVVACAAPDGVVYLSEDAGESWRVLATGFATPNAVLVNLT